MRSKRTLCALALLLAGAACTTTRWYKGNLHTHSLWSDGNDFPEMIADWYKKNGYDFLALSDHNILSEGEKWVSDATVARRGGDPTLARYLKRFGKDWVETREKDETLEIRLKTLAELRPLVEEPGKFLMIRGEEITDRLERLPIHLNASNLAELIPPQHGKTVREVMRNNVRAVQQQSEKLGRPILVHLNHPNFGWAITAEDLAAIVEERFFEVYNGHDKVRHQGDAKHASVERLWDIANTIRIAELGAPPLLGLATDDTHNYFGSTGATAGRGWIHVRASDLTAEAILAAIERGDFYASSGVTLADVHFDGQTLSLEIEPDGNASFVTEFVGTLQGFDPSHEPVLDKDGEPLRATERYSSDVGRVLARTEGLRPSYALTGKELYVRAVVTSSAPHLNPSFQEQKKQAWSQPVRPRRQGKAAQRCQAPLRRFSAGS